MKIDMIYREHLDDFPHLRDAMFRERGVQFKERLGWNLETDKTGRERDQYDAMNPLYIVISDEEGRHLGSTRLMPTTGPTMIGDRFSHMTADTTITSPLIWEVTRFFVSDRAHRKVAPALMWAGCAFARKHGINFYVGVTGAHMVRVFRACGWAAEVIGEADSDEGDICACLWPADDDQCEALRRKAGLPEGIAAPHVYRPKSGEAKQQAA